MVGSIFALVLTIGSIVLILMIRLRMLPLGIYVVLANTVWRDWASANEQIANILFFAILGLILLSWVHSAVRYVRP